MPLTIAPTETETVESGTVSFADSVEIGGQLNIAGELRISDASVTASGVGTATGSATATREKRASAVGAGIALTRRRIGTITSNETETVATGTVAGDGPLEIGGQLNIAGEVQITPTGPDRIRFASATGAVAGSGSGLGTAKAAVLARATGVGIGTAFGTGPGSGAVSVPAVRRDNQGLAWQEDEQIDLTLDDPTG